jgi:hypothetical protein
MRDLKIYRKLLEILGNYYVKFPNSKIGQIFEISLTKNLKVLPSEERWGQLEQILNSKKSVPGKIQEILNLKLLSL